LRAATGGKAIEPAAWDEETLDTLIRDRGGSEWHPVGTCRMGTDSAAVVDSTTMQVTVFRGLHVAMPQ